MDIHYGSAEINEQCENDNLRVNEDAFTLTVNTLKTKNFKNYTPILKYCFNLIKEDMGPLININEEITLKQIKQENDFDIFIINIEKI